MESEKTTVDIRGVSRKEVVGAIKVVEKLYEELAGYYKAGVSDYEDNKNYREIKEVLKKKQGIILKIGSCQGEIK
jgi:hypothetical protein